MHNQYNPKSCSELEKTFYTPIEAAIRWCGLIEYEEYIISQMKNRATPTVSMFPQWPCLRINVAKIFDAVFAESLPCVGLSMIENIRTTWSDTHEVVKKSYNSSDYLDDRPAKEIVNLTVRHSDLKEWMVKCYPDQKPAFLFDEIERTTHTAINADSFRALQVDRDSLNARLNNCKSQYKDLCEVHNSIKGERDLLKKQVDDLEKNMERKLLITIAALTDVILGNMTFNNESIGKHPAIKNQADLIERITFYKGSTGTSKRTLDEIFAAANRVFMQTPN